MRWIKTYPWSVSLLLGLMLLSLSACANAAAADALATIRQKGELRVVLDPSYPPFESKVSGELQGLDVDLARELGKRLGVQVVFVERPYEKLYTALDTREADLIISALYPEGDAVGRYAFTPPYFNAGQLIVVSATSPMQTRRDLAGKRVAVLRASEGMLEGTRWQYELNPPPQIILYDTAPDAIAALQNGEADALVAHAIIAHHARLQGGNLRVLKESVSDEPYVIAGRLEDEALIQGVAQLLTQIQNDGTWDQLLARWMKP